MVDYFDPVILTCENIDCPSGYSVSMTPAQFADALDDMDFECPHCKDELTISGLNLECYICGAEIDWEDVNEIRHWLGERCPYCAGSKYWDADFFSVVIRGSWGDLYSSYDWFERGKSSASLQRTSRSDYWEGVVHFCEAEEFISIYKERRIRAERTGLFKHLNDDSAKAVCLTEATEPNWDELRQLHGEYGFVFRKRDIIALGGAPTMYVPQTILDQLKPASERLPRKLWPYLSKLKIPSVSADGKKHDFLHEREWRVPQDVSFDTVRPFAVTFPKCRPGVQDDELILVAAREFQELSGRATSDETNDDTPEINES